MKHILKMDCYRLFHSSTFKLALLAAAVLGLWDLALNIQAHNLGVQALQTQTVAYSYPYSVYNASIMADGICLPATLLFALFPLLATLPFGASLVQDVKTGYLKNLTVQVPRVKLVVSRYLVTFLGAFAVVMFATVGQLVFSMMFLPNIMPEIASFAFPMMGLGQLGHSFYAAHPFLFLVLWALFDALFLSALACLALPIGWLTENIFLALVTPTAVYFVVSFLFEKLGMVIFCPDLFIRPFVGLALKPAPMLGELVVLLVMSAVLLAVCAHRRKDVF